MRNFNLDSRRTHQTLRYQLSCTFLNIFSINIVGFFLSEKKNQIHVHYNVWRKVPALLSGFIDFFPFFSFFFIFVFFWFICFFYSGDWININDKRKITLAKMYSISRSRKPRKLSKHTCDRSERLAHHNRTCITVIGHISLICWKKYVDMLLQGLNTIYSKKKRCIKDKIQIMYISKF